MPLLSVWGATTQGHVVGKKYWSKAVPGCTCEVIGEPDHNGLALGYITDLSFDPEGPFCSVLDLSQWSATEVVPVPDSLPEVLYMAIFGTFREGVLVPEGMTYEVFETEVGCAVYCSKRPNTIGYVPIAAARNGMVTP